MTRLPLRSCLLAGAALLLAWGCAEQEDRIAKEKIFSPEEPAADIQRAKESIPIAGASTDPLIWKRLWRMDRLEATRRIGAHRSASSVDFKWTRAGRTVTLSEEAKFESDAAGQFKLSTTNDQDAGVEFVWAEGNAYARTRYGPFRARRIDRAQQDVWRDEASASLRTVYDLFDRRLRASPLGAGQQAGRKVQRFALVLGEPWGPAQTALDAPPPLYGQVRVPGAELAAGPDDDTARRLDFERRRVPVSVTGELLVDEESAVVLKATVKARFTVPGVAAEPASTLELTCAYQLTPDPKVVVKAPEKVVAPAMPHAVNDPLWFVEEVAAAKAAKSAPKAEDEDDSAADDSAP